MNKVYDMAEKHNVSISEKLYDDIKDYCSLNGLKLNSFVEDLIRKSFNIEKFGETPFNKTVESQPNEHQQMPDDDKKELEVVTSFNKKMDEGMTEANKQIDDIVEQIKDIDKLQKDVDNLVYEEKPKKRKITRLN